MQPLLPYNVSAYTDFINASWVDFSSSDGSQLDDFDVETGIHEMEKEQHPLSLHTYNSSLFSHT